MGCMAACCLGLWLMLISRILRELLLQCSVLWVMERVRIKEKK